ncbi:MAG TPA: metalloregulator ArsR/SmtB family transcription factor [Burkholderiales bacterium]|nr:metalloregulator ArsR/SmtB family transcription factor [Burkholderiales bacterium]
METKQAVQALSALAQDTRLGIYRLLVQAGPEGMAAGSIGEKLDLAPATLSFHLAGLTRAGLAQSRQDGRFVIYTASFENMNALVAFLTENCCGGAACGPAACAPMTQKGTNDEAIPRPRRRA